VRHRRALLFVLPLLLAGVDAKATPTPSSTPALQAEEEAIAVDAESLSYDQKTDTVTATGKVLIRRGQTELRADRVELRRKTEEALATGGVTLTDPDGALYADEMRVNLGDETGEIQRGELRLNRRTRYSLWGDRIEKGEGQRYRIENGKFTTCDCDEGPPDWSFSGREVDVDAEGFGVVEGGTFNILDVPVLYLPTAVLPIGRERQSGLLLPWVGFSNRRGFQLLAPGYIAIDRSQDVSAALDVETSARLGALAQYRYAFSQNSRGQINASYFNDFLTSPSDRGEINPEIENRSIPENRWSVVGDHRQNLPWNTVGYADAFIVSDDSFLRDMNVLTVDRSVGDFNRTRRYTDSRLGAAMGLERTLVRLQGDYYQGFTQPQDLTLQKVPELTLFDSREVFGLVHSEVHASASAWVRQSGIDGFRVDLWPRLRLPIPTGLPFHASVFVGARETAYGLTQNQMRGGLNPDSTANFILDLPANSSREMVEAGADVGTEVARVYDLGWGGLQRVKHTIEPVLSYWYVPNVNQDELPIFDDVDRMDQRSLITYGFVSRLLGRFVDSAREEPTADASGARSVREASNGVRELVRLSLMQSYDTGRLIAPVGVAPGGPGSDHLSDIDLYLRASPIEAASFTGYTSYDTSVNDIAAAAASVRLTDTRTPPRHGRLDTRSSITLNYRFITRNLLQQVDGFAFLHFTDYIGALGGMRYDVLNSELLESRIGIRLLSTCDCWGLDLTFVDKSNPSEIEVRALLTLVGFGSAGS